MNYQIKMEKIIDSLTFTPKLLLHACCAPCSSYVLETLSRYFKISIVYYNPNITSKEEYNKRLNELKKFINLVKYENKIDIIECGYDNQDFFKAVK